MLEGFLRLCELSLQTIGIGDFDFQAFFELADVLVLFLKDFEVLVLLFLGVFELLVSVPQLFFSTFGLFFKNVYLVVEAFVLLSALLQPFLELNLDSAHFRGLFFLGLVLLFGLLQLLTHLGRFLFGSLKSHLKDVDLLFENLYFVLVGVSIVPHALALCIKTLSKLEVHLLLLPDEVHDLSLLLGEQSLFLVILLQKLCVCRLQCSQLLLELFLNRLLGLCF